MKSMRKYSSLKGIDNKKIFSKIFEINLKKAFKN